MILPLCSALVIPLLGCCVQLWGPQNKTDIDLLGKVLRRATKTCRELEHLFCGNRLRELGLFTLERKRFWSDLTVASQYLKVAYSKVRVGLLKRAGNYSTRQNGFKLREDRFKLDIRIKFFSVALERHWKRLLREAGDVLCLEVSKARLDAALSNFA